LNRSGYCLILPQGWVDAGPQSEALSSPAGIAANAILAGVTDTNALRQIPGYEQIMEVACQRNPNRRLTQPEDVARCIAALCHPATYWLTGNTLHVDGGENIVG
jgi:NAD(P)-dependent dehydrogenase (short-subunit alcohol dehydrogenase family)